MITALYNPQVNGQQHSGSRLKIHKGSDILQVGWRVSLYQFFVSLFYHFVEEGCVLTIEFCAFKSILENLLSNVEYLITII